MSENVQFGGTHEEKSARIAPAIVSVGFAVCALITVGWISALLWFAAALVKWIAGWA